MKRSNFRQTRLSGIFLSSLAQQEAGFLPGLCLNNLEVCQAQLADLIQMLQNSQRSPARYRSFSQPQFSDVQMQSPIGSQPSNACAPQNFTLSQPTPGYMSNTASEARPLIPRRRLLQPSPQPQNISQQASQKLQIPGYSNASLPPKPQAKIAGPRNLQFNGGISFQQSPPAELTSQQSPQQPFPSYQVQTGMRLESTQQTHYQHSRLGFNRFTQETGSQDSPQLAMNARYTSHHSPLQLHQNK